MRAARLIECPIGVYSVCASSVRIDRTTTSPVLSPDANFDGRIARRAQTGRILRHLLLHPQRRKESPLGMILMRDRRAEQREDSVAGGLHDVTVVAMHRVDHQFQRGIDNRARLFGIETLHQVHRSLDIREQRRHGFALAARSVLGSLFQIRTRMERRADKMKASPRSWGFPSRRQRCAAFAAKFELWRIFQPAARTSALQCGPAIAAELHSGRIFGAATRTSHAINLSPPPRFGLSRLVNARLVKLTT